MRDSTLDMLQPGEHGTIKQLRSSLPQVRQRLLELGMTNGTPVELIRVAPMGDPIEVKIKGYRLSLRRLEAEAVVVQRGR